MNARYEFLSLDDLEPYPSANHGDSRLMPLRRRLGLRAFGANCWTADVGKNVVPPHEEASGDEELYVVVRGRATFEVDERRLDAPAGTLVHVRPGEARVAVAEEPGTVVLAVGATPGKPFEPRGWDDLVVAFGEARSGRVAEGRRIMEALPEDDTGAWVKPYNLACFEALFGDRDAAFAHLRRAVDLSPEDARRYAAGDSDLEALHDDPRWPTVIR